MKIKILLAMVFSDGTTFCRQSKECGVLCEKAHREKNQISSAEC